MFEESINMEKVDKQNRWFYWEVIKATNNTILRRKVWTSKK